MAQCLRAVKCSITLTQLKKKEKSLIKLKIFAIFIVFCECVCIAHIFFNLYVRHSCVGLGKNLFHSKITCDVTLCDVTLCKVLGAQISFHRLTKVGPARRLCQQCQILNVIANIEHLITT